MEDAEEKAVFYYTEVIAISNQINAIAHMLFPNQQVSYDTILQEIKRLKEIEQKMSK